MRELAYLAACWRECKILFVNATARVPGSGRAVFYFATPHHAWERGTNFQAEGKRIRPAAKRRRLLLNCR